MLGGSVMMMQRSSDVHDMVACGIMRYHGGKVVSIPNILFLSPITSNNVPNH